MPYSPRQFAYRIMSRIHRVRDLTKRGWLYLLGQQMPSLEVYYDESNNRLVYYGKKASPEFWDNHWNVDNFKSVVEASKNDKFILDNTRRYLKKGRILEGGCGVGSNVYCLHYNGYSAFGVDFAKNTVANINKYFPELNVAAGDVRNLEQFENESFEGYWSLGVIEHFYEGYEDILIEMKRVVKKGGYVFLTFPYMSPLRRFKARFGRYKKFENNSCELKDFYQFALDDALVKNDFEKYGFALKYRKPFEGIKGLKDEITVFKPILQRLYDNRGQLSFIYFLRSLLSNLLSYISSHNILFVFEQSR